MGIFLGILFGLGLACIVTADDRPTRQRRARADPLAKLAEIARGAGSSMTGLALLGVCAGTLMIGVLLAFAVSRSVPVAGLFGLASGYAPIALLRSRSKARAAELRVLWPEIVDNLASAVRAGLSLPEALQQIGERGPVAMRPPFADFARDYQSTGRFHDCLDALKERLADPVGDRIVEALRIARDVGGGDLGRMLRSLSSFLRDDVRTRSELESRQSWTVNGARLAVAAPWLVVALMSLQPDVIARFSTPTGTMILVLGAAVCVVAYRLMMWMGELPTERRILR